MGTEINSRAVRMTQKELFLLLWVLRNLQISGANCPSLLRKEFGPIGNNSILEHIAGPITTFLASEEIDCQWECHRYLHCHMYSYCPSSKTCELRDGRLAGYTLKSEPGCLFRTQNCTTCANGGTCHKLGSSENTTCLCLPNYAGPTCNTSLLPQANGNPVCFGAGGDNYGAFYAPRAGQIIGFRFVHISGGVSWIGGAAKEGKWAGTFLGSNPIEVYITDSSKQIIYPPAGTTISKTWGEHSYLIPGVTNMDPVLPLTLPTPLPVSKGQEFQMWFGQDFYGPVSFEGDNTGSSCSTAYMRYIE